LLALAPLLSHATARSRQAGTSFGSQTKTGRAVRAHLDAVTEQAAAPVIAKYTGVLGGADIDIFTWTTTFAIMQSIRLDRGPSGPVHP
jgi:hypothetical protein